MTQQPTLDLKANEPPPETKTAKPGKIKKVGTKSQVAVRSASPAAVHHTPTSETAQVLAMIERAAHNPDTDIGKMNALLDLRDRIVGEHRKLAYNAAMSAAQAAIKPILTDSANDQTKSRYASFGALDDVIRPIYVQHGFLLTYDTEPAPAPDYVRVVCLVAHKDGHEKKHGIDMPADGKGARGGDVMTKTHATGAAMTYAQRYLLRMIFNVAVVRDDDGNAAALKTVGALLTPDQIATLRAYLKAEETPEPELVAFLDKTRPKKHPNLTRLEDLPETRLEEARKVVQRRADALARRDRAEQKQGGKDGNATQGDR